MKNVPCAYHQRQLITNFCKCSKCLLPVCPSCIKLHSQQHRITGTSPKFQQIQRVFLSVKSDQVTLHSQICDLRQSLLQIQASRKQNQRLIRKKLLQFRTRIAKQLDRYLYELQDQLLNKIKRDGQFFITDIESIDEHLFEIGRQVEIQIQELDGEETLKSIIVHLGQDRKQKTQDDIDGGRKMVEELARRSLYIAFDQGSLEEMSTAIAGSMQIEVLKGGDLDLNI